VAKRVRITKGVAGPAAGSSYHVGQVVSLSDVAADAIVAAGQAAYADQGVTVYQFPYSSGAQTTGTKKGQLIVPVAGTIVGYAVNLETPPTGATFIVDLNKGGTTLFTTQANRPIIPIAASPASTTLPDVVAVAAGDLLSYDIDQIGSGTAGSGLNVAIAIKHDLA
jgi:hypothetical protein